MATSSISASGLASGIDSSSIIESLTKIESVPLQTLQTRQTAIKSQISALGDIASKLSALQSAAEGLSSGGALALKVGSTNTAFSASPSTKSAAGRYSITVDALAATAKARSQGFDSSSAPVTGGTLHLDVQGSGYDVKITDGMALSDVAAEINRSGAPVQAALVSDGTKSYLSITNKNSGFPVGSEAASALVITETSTGSKGQALGAALVTPAANAKGSVDGLPFERQSNEVVDILPGTTLSLKAKTGATPEELVLSEDVDQTATNLGKFVTAFNDVFRLVQRQLAVTDSTSRESSLAGDPSIRALQQSLQRLTSKTVTGLGSVRSLADLGVKTARDGSLSLDNATLKNAIARDPQAVNSLFATASTGLGAVTKTLVESQTKTGVGTLMLRKDGLTKTVSSMDDQAAKLQLRIDKFRENLVKQFTAMETVVSKLKATGTYLSQQSALQSSNS